MISSPLALAAVIVVTALVAFWLDHRVDALGRVGASLMCLAFGALLSNLGLVPVSSPVYGFVAGPLTMLAIAWLLLAVDLRDLEKAGPRVLAAYGLAAVGTALGALVGAFVFAGSFGEDTWKLAGTLTGTYIGGGLNFVAVGQGLELPPALFAGATAADNLTTGLWLSATLVLPIWLARFYPPVPDSAFDSEAMRGEEHEAVVYASERHALHPFFRRDPLSTLDLAWLAAIAVGLLAVSEGFGALLARWGEAGTVPGWLGSIPVVLWLTTFALIVGHSPLGRDRPGALQLGSLALHFFFVVLGIWSRVSEILAVGVEVFLFTLTVVLVHGLVVFGVGRAVRLDPASLAVASQASVGGPSSSLAVAVSRGWPGLILPGIIVGLAGYAVGTYLGFGLAYLVRGWGVGL